MRMQSKDRSGELVLVGCTQLRLYVDVDPRSVVEYSRRPEYLTLSSPPAWLWWANTAQDDTAVDRQPVYPRRDL